jgi:hypothetical protein
MENTEQTTIEKQTSSFELDKLSKGFNWKIKIYDDDIESAKIKIKNMDDWFRTNWGALE